MKRTLPLESKVCLITDRTQRVYFSGVDVEDGYLLIGKSMVYLTDARYFSSAKVKLEEKGLTAKLYESKESIKESLCSLGGIELMLDYNTVTIRDYEEYKTFGYPVCDGGLEIDESIAVKTDVEISFIKQACEIAEKAYYTAISSVKKGMTEIELKNTIEDLMIKYGAEGTSFDTIVAFGENSAVPHHETGNTVLKDNSVVLVDMGCKVKGFCSDLTRTAFFGKPSEKFINCYEFVKQANILSEQTICAGMTTVKADSVARNYLAEHGLAEKFTHSLGHGIGRKVHEYPYLSPKKNAVLKNGTVFSVEPGVYFDGEFGIRIEDTVMLKNGKVERLFSDSKELLIL